LAGRVVARYVEKLCELSRHKRSDAAILFFFAGMLREDSAKSQVSNVSRSAESLFYKINQLLKSCAALMVAPEVMLDGYRADNFPLPYLAAEGMRAICRVGLEIVRVLQKRKHPIHLDGKKEADVLTMEITSTVRNCLDEHTRMFYTDASERTQMLILESRFARLAYYKGDSWPVPAHSERVLVEPNAFETLDTLNAMRYEFAFNFLNEAETCIANNSTSDAVRLRFLSERCSSLRYLSESLSRVELKNQNDRTGYLERALVLCRLALLDVRQLRNLIGRLTQSKSVLLTHAREARWSSPEDYHDKRLRDLKDQLEFAQWNLGVQKAPRLSSSLQFQGMATDVINTGLARVSKRI
jgi:hypothetical protein